MANSKKVSQRYREKDPQLVYELLPRIEQALSATLGLQVEDAVRYLDEGNNLSFKVITDQGKVMVRIFRFSQWPDRQMLKYIDTLVETQALPALKRLYLDTTDIHFPYGFSVRWWQDGILLHQLYTLDLWSRYQLMEVVGKLLRQVHHREKKFGLPPFGRGRKGYPTFLASQLAEFQRPQLLELIQAKAIDPLIIEEVKHTVQALIQATPGEITPVFSHGDPQPSNVLLTETGPLLIDWEQARSTSWVHDFAIITFWWEHSSRRDLFDAYLPTKEQQAQFDFLEVAHHLMYSLELLSYFFSMGDQNQVVFHRQRIDENMAQARRVLQNAM